MICFRYGLFAACRAGSVLFGDHGRFRGVCDHPVYEGSELAVVEHHWIDISNIHCDRNKRNLSTMIRK